MITKWVSILVVVCSLGALACSKDASSKQVGVNCVQKYNLPEAVENREFVGQAVFFANRVLGSDVGFRFHLSWGNGTPDNYEPIPVALVYFDPPGKYGTCFVPKGDRCVLIDATELSQLESFFSQGLKNPMPIEREELLALVLLHEAGHLYHAYSGAFDLSLANKTGLNVEENDTKQQELQADTFAASQIKAGTTPGKNTERFLTSIQLAMALSKISFNLTGSRILDHPGSTVLNLPTAFQDAGYSHPNLYWRILQMNYVLNPSPTTTELLKDFEQRRERSTNTAPLFQLLPP